MWWTVLDWLLTILLVVGFVVWAIWFAMRVIKAYALADGSGLRRLGAALVTVLSASWATVAAPFKWLWLSAAKSLTFLWSYMLFVGSYAIANLDDVGQLLGDPDLKQQIVDLLKDRPQLLGVFLAAIALITIITRARSIVFRPKE